MMQRNRAVPFWNRGVMFVGIIAIVLAASGFKGASNSMRFGQLRSSDQFAPISIRSQPSSQAKALHLGFTGDRVAVLDQQNRDGSLWYQVRFQKTGAIGWVRSDLVRLSAAPTTGKTVANTLSQDQISYFMEIALGNEFYQEANPILHKWEDEVRIQIIGQPTSADLGTVQTVINEINELTQGNLRLRLVSQNPNLKLHFVPEAQFSRYEPGYVPVNYGFFMTNWDAGGIIRSANVLITSQKVTQRERSHLIREELTQSLGLMRDSYKHPNSMFYQPWTDVTEFSDLDRALIQLLYSADLRAGMTRTEVATVLNRYQAQGKLPLPAIM